MSIEFDPEDPEDSAPDEVQPMIYQIRVKGHLGPEWIDWFGGLTITLQDNGDTLLTCPVEDQAALYGLLRKVRDLGLPLISVTHAEPGLADGSDIKPQVAPPYFVREKQDECD